MQTNNGPIFLRLLVNKYYTGKPDMLAKILPKEDADLLAATLLPQKDPNLLLFLPQSWLASFDRTWLEPVVEKMPKPLREIYAKAFPKYFAPKSEQNQPSIYNETVQDFLINHLKKSWGDYEAPPKDLLPTWELSPLLGLQRQELIEIVDLLAIYDLVEEMRHIVDKRLLQAVLQYLSVEQQHYLRALLRQKSRQLSSTLSIRELLKEGKKFKEMLHKLGLQRLSNALSGASNDFTWHILHAFDFNRAKFLQNHIKKEEVPKETPLALLQVQHVLQYLKTETAP